MNIDNFGICLTNIRSLNKNVDEFKTFLKDLDTNIVRDTCNLPQAQHYYDFFIK